MSSTAGNLVVIVVSAALNVAALYEHASVAKTSRRHSDEPQADSRRVFDGELLALATKVERPMAPKKSIERAAVRKQRAQPTSGEVPNTGQALRDALRLELEALMRAH